ncbi:MAG: hypothetical protein SGARI_001247 [Bacillariaceae sp.]
MKQSRASPGYYYYYNMDTGLSTWDPPLVEQIQLDSLPQPMEEDTPMETATAATKQQHGREGTEATSKMKEEEEHKSAKRRKTADATASSSSSSSEPKEVRVFHILKKHKGSRRPSSWRNPKITATKEEAHEELEGLLEILQDEEGNPQELRATFEELARTESDCSSAKRGGDLGFFGRKKMQPAFEAASFALKKGELTKKIVDTSSGSHILLRIG